MDWQGRKNSIFLQCQTRIPVWRLDSIRRCQSETGNNLNISFLPVKELDYESRKELAKRILKGGKKENVDETAAPAEKGLYDREEVLNEEFPKISDDPLVTEPPAEDVTAATGIDAGSYMSAMGGGTGQKVTMTVDFGGSTVEVSLNGFVFKQRYGRHT